MLVTLTNSYDEILTPKDNDVKKLGLWEALRSQGLQGTSALMKETPERLLRFLPCEGTARRQLSVTKDASPHQTLDLVVPDSWTSQLPEL